MRGSWTCVTLHWAVVLIVICACGPLTQFGDNFYLVTFQNETSRTLLLFDEVGHQGREQVAAPGQIVRQSYPGAYRGAWTIEFWNQDLTRYYCATFTRDEFAKVKYRVVINGPRSDC